MKHVYAEQHREYRNSTFLASCVLRVRMTVAGAPAVSRVCIDCFFHVPFYLLKFTGQHYLSPFSTRRWKMHCNLWGEMHLRIYYDIRRLILHSDLYIMQRRQSVSLKPLKNEIEVCHAHPVPFLESYNFLRLLLVLNFIIFAPLFRVTTST